MKRLITICLIFLSLGISAQNLQEIDIDQNTGSINFAASEEDTATSDIISISETFEEAAKKNNVAYRTFENFQGVEDGYYAIVGVFKEGKNIKKSIKRLNKKGFDAGYIINPENSSNYVYLQYFPFGLEAVDAVVNQFEGKYKDDVWILSVDNSFSTEESAIANSTESLKENIAPVSAKEVTYDMPSEDNSFSTEESVIANSTESLEENIAPVSAKEVAYDMPSEDSSFSPEESAIANSTKSLEETMPLVSVKEVTYDMLSEEISSDKLTESVTAIKEGTSKSKLLKKADLYFDKMWYAEAAELYEQVLSKGGKHYTYEVIQKAGDSYYYNTNMEKAYEWYNILYDKYGKDMSADNVFKYAHSLKGTGKYARSKRLMRLYDKKMEGGEVAGLNEAALLRNEVVLDEIMNNERDYELKNLSINSEYSDFSPMFLDSTQVVFASAKDSSVLNTRRYKWNDQPYLDLYVAKINEETQDLKDAIKFSNKLNTKYHEASVTFSPDNSTMYFTRNNYGKKLKRDKNGVNHLKIYMSKKVGDEWAEAEEVPFNSDDYSTGHPALSPDGKQLYFVSDMPGSIGQTDIFVVDVTGPNSFSEPRNLGPEINTERKEMFPFINDKKLYFSSDGHTGLGGLDVYEVAYTEEEGFEEVKNLGQPINSNRDDFSYIINEENQQGFFASNRIDGKGDDDIYSFKRLVIEEVPASTNAIAGVVTKLITGDIMPKALVELLDENGIKLKEMAADDDGSFIFEDLEADKKYTIKANRDTYFENVQEVTTIENDTVQVAVEMRKLQEMIAVEDGIKKLKMEMIYFSFDRFNIRQEASNELDKLVEVMTEYPNMVIKIESHTDSRGKKAYNKYLSDKRAKSTRDYIISKGIAAERIESAIGYGEEQLLNNCDGKVACTEQEHYLNRRSEFIILNM